MSEILDTRDMLSMVKDGIHRGLRIVNIRSKEAYDALKIKNNIRRLARRRRDTVLDMGNAIYRSYKHKGSINGDNIQARCAEIEWIEGEIEEWEEKLRLVHLNAEKALGSVKALAKPRVVAVCDCGAEIHEGARFCGNCFKKIESPGG